MVTFSSSALEFLSEFLTATDTIETHSYMVTDLYFFNELNKMKNLYKSITKNEIEKA